MILPRVRTSSSQKPWRSETKYVSYLNSRYKRVERLTVSHESEEVHVRLHGLGIEPAEIPIVRCQSQTDTILVAISGTHLFEEQGEVASISKLAATALRFTGVLPIDIDTRKAILVHVVASRLDESGPVGLGRDHVTPSGMGGSFRVAHVEASNGDPSLEITVFGKTGKLTHLLDVIVVGGGDREGRWINEGE
jgi:Fe2+ transport system protein FeoA